ncbi:MAG TPA: FCD domain-containing protein [Flexivirga sp.]|uniref:GntR family transcriptional regulator n=1 Tax=Flexivirga sp. TaxID=1962927 RepID=UPI002C92FF02|nr:FCD domain-containing protein [Flexivirga sp.]HWC24021.1 FCD domain-containing protein [Flexivirga sp.]
MPRERANADQTHARIRADILGGLYEPGQKLKFADLGQRYGASASVVRECLTRLSQQGLVVAEPMIGFRVMPLSLTDLADLTATRIDLETIALRAAIAHGDMDWETAMVAAHHRLERTPVVTTDGPPRVSDEWERVHAQFHAALLAGCGRPRLLEMTVTLRDAAELYRRWSQPRDPQRDVAAEHRAIFEAALARRSKDATAALRSHYEHTAAILQESLSAAESPSGSRGR